MLPELVLGLGDSVDLEVRWSEGVVQRLTAAHGIRAEDLDTAAPIRDERDLLRVVLAYLRDGLGGERFVERADVIRDFAGHFEVDVSLGGTGVRAAAGLAVLGFPSTVHLVSINDTVRRLLPSCSRYVCSALEDSDYPHLIVQFPVGARIRLGDVDIVTRQPNRVILVNDPPNRELVLHEDLVKMFATADAVLVSGFNSIQDVETLELRLAQLGRGLERRPAGCLVYFEDAAYHKPDLARRVRDAMVRAVDVYGMNEDEMERWLGRRVDLLDPLEVAHAMTELAGRLPARTRVVHTRYWALAHGAQPERLRSALLTGSALAGARYGVGDACTSSDVAAVAAGTVNGAGRAFATALESALPDAVCEPAYDVAAAAPTTVGLGDWFVGGFLAGAVSSTP